MKTQTKKLLKLTPDSLYTLKFKGFLIFCLFGNESLGSHLSTHGDTLGSIALAVRMERRQERVV